jgi:hypothetical protein
VFDSPSCPPSIEDIDCQWRAGRSREERSARVEVKTTPNHNEKEQKGQTTNAPCLVFMSTVTLQCGRDLDCFELLLSSLTYWLKSPLCQRGQRFAVPPYLASANRQDGAFANSACEYSRCN